MAPSPVDEQPSNVVATPTTALAGELQTDCAGRSASGAATFHVRVAGGLSRVPAAAVPGPANGCDCAARLEWLFGVPQPPQAPPSMRHRYVEPDSEEVKRKL